MSLLSTYKEYLVEQLMLSYLYNGEIPTNDDLEEDLLEYQKSHLDLSKPASKYISFIVDHGAHSSSGLIHSIADTLSQDIGVVTREIYKVAKDSSVFYDRWVNEIKRISGRAKKLEQRIDSLLLLREDTTGFYSFVGDTFADANYVDTDNTTAKLDIGEEAITINPLNNNSLGYQSAIDTSSITETDIYFNVLSNKKGTSYSTTNKNNSLLQVFKSYNSTWVGAITAKESGDMVCELKAKISDSEQNISKIKIEYPGPISNTSSTISCLYSTDGYTWNLVPTNESTKSLSKIITWSFPEIQIKWIKFIFRKANHDEYTSGLYKYILSISSIKLYSFAYSDSDNEVFISKSLQAVDVEDNVTEFSMVSLDVCEELPTNTDIAYYVAASKDNSSWTSWTRISPSSHTDLAYPKIINFGGVDWASNKYNSDITYVSTPSSPDNFDQMKLTSSFDIEFTGYRFKNKNFGVINTAIPISSNINSDSIANNIVLWRNTRSLDTTSEDPDTLKVRGNIRGWKLEGNLYTCYFEIVNSNGQILKFGNSKCIIDGQEVTGDVSVPKGIHKFSTYVENWADINSNFAKYSDIKTEQSLKDIDSLYPYNHKLIIEGFRYITNFKGEKKYTGTNISAEYYCEKTSLFDLENKLDDFIYYAVKNIGDDSPYLGIIIKFDSSQSDFINELFYLKWRANISATSSSLALYKYIKLKAELSTDDTDTTPMLLSYRLKLGM